MIMHELQEKIKEEQAAKITALLESIAVSLFAVITAALLPQLIVQYLVRDGEFPTTQPVALMYLPHFCYALVLFAFVAAVLNNFVRSRRIRAYRQELELLALNGEDCCGECCGGACMDGHDEEEMASFEPDMADEDILDEIVEIVAVKPARAVKATPAKKTAKQTSKK